ncbi:hypothetical protein MTO96_033778 [Rhipicephalus appendiculatus]
MARPLRKNRERHAGHLPFEMQWAASPYWPAAPVDFWAQSATGQGYPDLSGNEEAEPSTSNSGVSAVESAWMSNVTRMLIFSVLLIALLVASMLLGRTSAWLSEHDEVTGRPAEHLSPLAVGVASGRSSGVGPWMRANSSRRLAAGTNADSRKRVDSREDVDGPLRFSNGDRCEEWNFPAGLFPATNGLCPATFLPGAGFTQQPLWSATGSRLRARQNEKAFLRQYGRVRSARAMFESYGPQSCWPPMPRGKEPLQHVGGSQEGMYRQRRIMTEAGQY